MNANEHYAQAEKLLRVSDEVSIDDGHAQLVATQAQVHATLALAARPIVVIASDVTSELLTELTAALNPDPSKPSEDQ